MWLWCRLAAAAAIQPLAWGLPYAEGAALKSHKKRKNAREGGRERGRERKEGRRKDRKGRCQTALCRWEGLIHASFPALVKK